MSSFFLMTTRQEKQERKEFLTAVHGLHYHKNIGIQLKASVCITHMRRKVPTITSQSRRFKMMGKLLVIFQWESLTQPNIYKTEEHESLWRWNRRSVMHPRFFKEAWRFLVWWRFTYLARWKISKTSQCSRKWSRRYTKRRTVDLY